MLANTIIQISIRDGRVSIKILFKSWIKIQKIQIRIHNENIVESYLLHSQFGNKLFDLALKEKI